MTNTPMSILPAVVPIRITAPARNREALQRRLLADFCRMILMGGVPQPVEAVLPRELSALSPRLKQTLGHLMLGRTEKEIARQMEISVHTVHVYVKVLHKRFLVNNRSHLVARF